MVVSLSRATYNMNIKQEEFGTSLPEPKKQQKFFCAHCSYTTKNKPSLKAHVRCHAITKPYACEQCQYKTADKSCLKSHLRVHTGEKPHHCSYCDYRTTSKYYLKQHESVHTKNHLFRCEICEVNFRYRSSYNLHMKKHMGEEKVLKCKLCTFQTTCASSFRGHVVRHSDEKPFACTQCSYRAKLKKMVNQHMRYRHLGFKRKKQNSSSNYGNIFLDLVSNDCIVFNSIGSSGEDTDKDKNTLIKIETVPNECLVFNSYDYVITEEKSDLIYDENVVKNSTYVNGLPKPIKNIKLES